MLVTAQRPESCPIGSCYPAPYAYLPCCKRKDAQRPDTCQTFSCYPALT